MLGRGGAESRRGTPQSLNHNGIAFIVPVKNEAQYLICLRYIDALRIPSGYTVEKIAVFGGSSMAEVYQRAMEASTARYKIYLHVDTYVIHLDLLPELLNLFMMYPRLGLVGVIGGTQLPSSGWWLDDPEHCYGRVGVYFRPPGLFFGRRVRVWRCRSFTGDYQPAVQVDGLFMATQFDIPWIHPEFGFELYDQVQSLEYIKAGFEVGIVQQAAIWCRHWGPIQRSSREQLEGRQIAIRRKAEMIRQLYPDFIGVPATKLYAKYRVAAGRYDVIGACPPFARRDD